MKERQSLKPKRLEKREEPAGCGDGEQKSARVAKFRKVAFVGESPKSQG